MFFDTWKLIDQQKVDKKFCWLEHCSSSLEKFAARIWLGSKSARKFLARNSTRLEKFWLEMLEPWKFWLGPITTIVITDVMDIADIWMTCKNHNESSIS